MPRNQHPKCLKRQDYSCICNSKPGLVLSNRCLKLATSPVRVKTILAQSVIRELRHEARIAKVAVDDDTSKVPSPLDSPQSRRAARQEVSRV